MGQTHRWAMMLPAMLAACSGGQPAAEKNESAASQAVANAANASNAAGADNSAANAAAPAKTVAKVEEKATDKAAVTPEAPAKDAAAAAKPQPAPAPVEVAVAPPTSFARCVVCHDATKGGQDKLGPNLYGVFGKTAGKHRAGFNYSPALKASGLVWNEANLDKWLTKPMDLVPGTMMSFPGLKDPAKRQELIDYLKSLK